ncbi:MAG TPA: hypothetical protein VK175_05040 [Leadbetterella sp.]|nr:hypothetical protein [Leadbetterella sp.]
MKRNIVISSILIALFSISAITYKKLNSKKDFHLNSPKKQTSSFFNKYLVETLDNTIYYNLESKFTVSKDKLSNANSVLDIYTKLAGESSENIASTSIAKLKADMSPIKIEDGERNILNESQTKLLKSLDYEDKFLLKILIKKKINSSDKIVTRLLTYHLTVVPEKVAEYSLGKKSFIDFIRKNTEKETLNITKQKIGSGTISFVVLANGKVSDIKLNNESRLRSLDDKLIKLLKNLPAKWNPARNAQGEAVAQELIFSFGNPGC